MCRPGEPSSRWVGWCSRRVLPEIGQRQFKPDRVPFPFGRRSKKPCLAMGSRSIEARARACIAAA